MKRIVVLLFLGGCVLGLSYFGLHSLDTKPIACSECGRPVHAEVSVEGVVDGESRVFCCAACAMSARRQGTDVEITGLSDYLSAEPIDPGEAFVVVGSDVNLCLRHEARLGTHKEASDLHFDRCVPSIIAFRNRTSAVSFQYTNGGIVRFFPELDTAAAAQ